MNETFSDLEMHLKEPEGFAPCAQAVGCYIEIDGKLLLLQYTAQKKIHRDKWDVPGGMLEENETPVQGALRELFEETGIAREQLTDITHVLTLYIRGKKDYIFHQFKCEMPAIPSVYLSSEHQNYTWASTQDLREIPLVEGAMDVLERYRYAVDKQRTASVNAYLILRDQKRVLFLLRKNTGYCDGMWGLVSGHVEHSESASDALMREAKEEIGIIPSQIKPVHVMHRKSDRNNVDIFFDCGEWNGTINNNEMEKCAACAFYSLDALPSPLIDYIGAALKSIEQGHFYSEYGWHRT